MSHVVIKTSTLGFRIGVDRKGGIKGSPLSIMDYSRRFEHRQWDKNAHQWILVNEFFHFDGNQEICYFPRYELPMFQQFLEDAKVKYQVEETPPEEGKHVSFYMLPHITYKNDKQKAAVEFLTDPKSGSQRGLALQTGVGKAQPLYSKILTPRGWDLMGNMKVGSKVIAADGTVTHVTGVFPQGVKNIYRITFEDDRWAECCDDHLWRVYYTQWKEKWRVISLKEITEYLKQPTYRARMGIQLPLPEEMSDINLPIDPYLMGVLLGDGSFTGTCIRLSSADQFIVDKVSHLIPEDMKLTKSTGVSYYISQKSSSGCKTSKFIDEFRNLGLYGKLSHQKFIPSIYMHSSPAQKLHLLQGLMDTDGTVGSRNGVVSFCTTSLEMATQVQSLIRSLGGLARISLRSPSYTHNGEKRQGKTAYHISIRFKDPTSLFQLPRKKEIAPQNYQYKDRLRARIKSVEYIGQCEAQCIQVAHPDHLYVTDNYVVTHNSVSFIWALQKLGRRSMITMTSRLEQWVSEIGKYTTLDEDDLFVVQGVGSLTKLFSQIDNQIKPKIILASTKTIQLYLNYGPTYQHLPHPSEMCEKLGIGIVGTDEYHEWFYTNFLIGIILNPALFIPITATFIANDPFVKNIFDRFVPKEIQFTGGEYEKYVNITSYQYTSGFQIKPYYYSSPQGYSQVKFEAYLLGKGRRFLDSLIEDAVIPIIKNHYINMAEKGERFLFLCATKDLCNHLEGVLKRHFKDKKISVFYSGMPTTVLENYDMILSTPGSAGTGRDIKNLRTCFIFESTGSETRNTQFLGRLRGPPQMMNTPEFVYISLKSIPQHVKYHNMRAMLYGPKALSFKHRSIS